MRKIMLYTCLQLCAIVLYAQKLPVAVKVTNAHTGEGVIGATLNINNVSGITSTGGMVSVLLEANKSHVLITSASGFKPDTTNVNIAVAGAIYIQLWPEVKQLQEVIVSNGYQELNKERAAGSYEKIDNTLLNRSVSNDIISRLENITSGLYFNNSGGEPKLFIRGLSTLNAGTDPLIVLDNFPYDGDLNNIDPDNIESITLLKDATAASIWGARAANAVIVITSKTGKYLQSLSLSFNSNLRLQQKPDIKQGRNFMPANEFIEVERMLFQRGFYDGELNDLNNFPVLSPAVELMAQHRAGQLTDAELNNALGLLASNDIRSDYLKYLYKPAQYQQYSISLSGGASKANYFIGLGFDRNHNEIVRNKDNRANITARVTMRPVPKLELQTGITYTYAQNQPNGFNSITASPFKSAIYPYAQLADANGKPISVAKDYRAGYTDTSGVGYLLNWKYNPLQELAAQDNRIVRNDVLIAAGIKYSINKVVSLQLNSQLEQTDERADFYYNINTYYARNIINRFTNRNGTVVKYHVPVGGILDRGNRKLQSAALRTQVNVQHDFLKHWNLSGIAGAELRQAKATGDDNRTYGYNGERLTFGNVDYATQHTLWGNLGSEQIERNTRFNETENRFVSYFSNAAVSYKNRYTFTASVRKDASNLFGINSNQKWNPFWSAGAAWNVNEEKFYKLRFFPVVKARLSYGFSGNIIPGISGKPVISYGQNSVIPLPYANISSTSNPDLKWEETGTGNLGIDFESRKNIINGSIDFYIKKSMDLFSEVPVDPTLGILSNTINAANLSSSGFNLKLNSVLVNRGLQWTVFFLADHTKTKVTRAFNEYANKGAYVDGGLSIKAIEGKDPYALISYRWAGLDPQTGAPRGYINDTVSLNYNALLNPSSFRELKIHGSSRPKLYGSIRHQLDWNQLRFSFNISYAFGYYFRRSSISYNRLFQSWAMNVDFANRWQKPGDELHTNVPAMIYPGNNQRDMFYQFSEATVEKGDHIRLRDIQASYSLKALKTSSRFLKQGELYVYVNNIGILWRANKHNIDPDFGNYIPRPLSVSLGFKSNF